MLITVMYNVSYTNILKHSATIEELNSDIYIYIYNMHGICVINIINNDI